METIKDLKEDLQWYINHNKDRVNIYLNKLKGENDFRYIKNIYDIEEYRALKSIYIDQNIYQAKQHFYSCSRLDLYLINNHNTTIWPSNMVNALLSDNKKVIKGYAILERKSSELDSLSFNAMLSILNNDMKALVYDIEIAKKVIKRSRNFWVRFYELCKVYYEGILEHDKQKVEDAIIQLVEPKFQKKRARKDIVNLLDFHGAGFAKLAWHRGLEVEINSYLVPQILLPIKPNKSYAIPYDFLDDKYV